MREKLEVLPAAQHALWERFSSIDGFVLYGGTAIALQLGHRQSIDFDFFTQEPLDVSALDQTVEDLGEAVLLRSASNTLEYSVDGVRVSFYGSLKFGRVGEPVVCTNRVFIASLLDLFGHTLKVIQQRAEFKDYADIIALLGNGLSLSSGLGAATALFPALNPQVSLRALSFFGDIDGLTKDQQNLLERCAAEVREVAPIAIKSDRLSPGTNLR
jgi:hypothetical protein